MSTTAPPTAASPRAAGFDSGPRASRPHAAGTAAAVRPTVIAKQCKVRLGQIEQQEFGFGNGRCDQQEALFLDPGTVAGEEPLAVEVEFAADDLQPCPPAGEKPMCHFCTAVETTRVDVGVLVDQHRAAAPVARGDQPQTPALLVIAEGPLVIARRQSVGAREQPD